MADNTDNREGAGGEELPDDLKRLVDAAQQDAEDTGAQEAAGGAWPHGHLGPGFRGRQGALAYRHVHDREPARLDHRGC